MFEKGQIVRTKYNNSTITFIGHITKVIPSSTQTGGLAYMLRSKATNVEYYRLEDQLEVLYEINID